MPAPAVMTESVLPFVVALGLHPGTCLPLGVHPSCVPPRLCAPEFPSLCVAPLPSILWLLISFFWCMFHVRARGRGYSTPCQFIVSSPAPPLPGHAGSVSLPGSASPLTPPFVFLIPPPWLNFVGNSARSWRYARMWLSWYRLLG